MVDFLQTECLEGKTQQLVADCTSLPEMWARMDAEYAARKRLIRTLTRQLIEDQPVLSEHDQVQIYQ